MFEPEQPNPTQRPTQAAERALLMPIAHSLRRRLEKLEQARAPAARIFIFTGVPRADDDYLSHDDQLAAFKRANGVTERDYLVVVTYDDPV